jgi:transcriptional regulator with XRE-family HTH domain
MKHAVAIAERLRRAMAAAGWTQMGLADKSGVDQSQLSRILKGEFVRITENVKKVCKYANVDFAATASNKPLPKAVATALRDLLDGTKERERAVVGLLKAEARLLRREGSGGK